MGDSVLYSIRAGERFDDALFTNISGNVLNTGRRQGLSPAVNVDYNEVTSFLGTRYAARIPILAPVVLH